jgi:energy-coupling factor transporter ATP-binding protein EcfA2
MELSGRPLLDTKVDRPLYLRRPGHGELLRLAHRGANVLVLGERGSGKTTMLNQVAGELENSGIQVVSLEGRLVEDAQSFIRLVGERFGSRAGGSNFNRLPGYGSDVAPGVLDALDALNQLAVDSGEERRVVICDEPPPAVVHTVFGRLRDQVWQLPFTWIVAGNLSDEDIYLTPPADAFFERVLRLEVLSLDEARQLVALRSPELDASSMEALVSSGPPTPRELLHRVAALVHSEDRRETILRWSATETKVAGLSRPEAMAFAEILALGPVSASDKALLGRLRWTRERAVQVLGRLEETGLVETFEERAERGRPRKMFRAKVPG